MFGSSIIDVAIGIIFVFLLMSLIATAVNEIIFSLLRMRGKELLRGIQTLLNDGKAEKLLIEADGLVKDIYNHGHVFGLFQGEFDGKNNAGHLPSYIPSRNFALALLDIVPKKAAVEKLKMMVAGLAPGDAQRTLNSILPHPAANAATAEGKQPELAKPVGEIIKELRDAASKISKDAENAASESPSNSPASDKEKLGQIISIANVALGESLSPVLQARLQDVARAAIDLPQGAGGALAAMASAATPANIADILEKMGDAAQKLSGVAPHIGVLLDAAKSEADPVQTLRKAAALIDAKVGQPLIAIIKETSGEVSLIIGEVEAWYNSAMDRVSGWYKYKTQTALFWLGVALAVILNANTITIVQALSRNTTLRQSVVAAAQQYGNSASKDLSSGAPPPNKDQSGSGGADNVTQAAPSLEDQLRKVHDQVSSMEGLGLPLGWSHSWHPSFSYAIPENVPKAQENDDKLVEQTGQFKVIAKNEEVEQPWTEIAVSQSGKWQPLRVHIGAWLVACLGTLAGWLITAFAVSLGAPFWFDMLNKIMVVRSTVKPREKSPEEASKS
jgi:hypothetical protein